MTTPKFLDNPDSNSGIIRQIIFPKFRGINKFLYTKQNNKMVYKIQQSDVNSEYVQFNFDNTLKYENILNDIREKKFEKITKIFSDLIIECIKTIGLSEYIIEEMSTIFTSQLDLFESNDFILNENDQYSIEKLMTGIFEKYMNLVTTAGITAQSISIFFPSFNDNLKLSNPLIIKDIDSEYNKYLKLINFESSESFFTKDEYSQFDEDGLALTLSYIFYYVLKDIFSSCYLYIKLPDPPVIPVPFNELSINILEEITLDLKNITNVTKLPDILQKLPQDIATKKILNKTSLPIDFDLMRKNKSSYEELKGKLRKIHNYYKNNLDSDVIRVIQWE